jgi:adenylylsulfate kinase
MSWAVWVTGGPGSASSTLAQAAAARLAAQGESVTVLGLDCVRRVLTPLPTGSAVEHDTVYRALVFMAVALTEAGIPVVIDAPAEHRAWRDLARASITRFAEIHVQAAEGPPPDDGTVTPSGPLLGHEHEESAELTVDTRVESIEAAADRIAQLRQRWPTAGRRRGRGAVIWITGPPGSGKTTQTSRLAEALSSEQVEVTILAWSALRAAVLGGPARNEGESEVAHRGLAYTAKLLADAGLTVVVDATAPRRVWRSLARELVGTFAEVQLVCPLEICLTRERVARWGPRPYPHRGSAAPDIVLDYEYSLSPDLVLDTATRSEWSASEDLLRLARRLLRRLGS